MLKTRETTNAFDGWPTDKTKDNTLNDRNTLERVQAIDTIDNFAELLGYAGRFQRPEIRELAAQKARAHPVFAAALDLVETHALVRLSLERETPPDEVAVAVEILLTVVERARRPSRRT